MKDFPWYLVILYIFLDIVAIGALGMGIPIFGILLGLPAGWVLAWQLFKEKEPLADVHRGMLRPALLMSAFSGLVLLAFWNRFVTLMFRPAADLANLRIPMFLPSAHASLIVWVVLMLVIAPVLQFLMILLGFKARTWGVSRARKH